MASQSNCVVGFLFTRAGVFATTSISVLLPGAGVSIARLSHSGSGYVLYSDRHVFVGRPHAYTPSLMGWRGRPFFDLSACAGICYTVTQPTHTQRRPFSDAQWSQISRRWKPA